MERLLRGFSGEITPRGAVASCGTARQSRCERPDGRIIRLAQKVASENSAYRNYSRTEATTPVTRPAPRARSTNAASRSVEPVVRTSSTRRTCAPATRTDDRHRRTKRARRARRECCASARTCEPAWRWRSASTHRSDALRASECAIASACAIPRERERRNGVGTGTTTASASPGATTPHAAACRASSAPSSSAIGSQPACFTSTIHRRSAPRCAPSRTMHSGESASRHRCGTDGDPAPHRGHHDHGRSGAKRERRSDSAGTGSPLPSSSSTTDWSCLKSTVTAPVSAR